MAITRWNPFQELKDLHREIDRIFSRTFGREGLLPSLRAEVWIPAMDMYRKGENLVVKADLPGIRPEDVDISISEGLLTIKGERHCEEIKEEDLYMQEICPGKFERNITLPEAVRADKAEASFANGLLELTVPLEAAKAPKKVKVQVKEIKAA